MIRLIENTGRLIVFSREISTDIIHHLQIKRGLSIDDISKFMETSSENIQSIIDKKTLLKAEHIKAYLKNTNTPFWELTYDAVPLEHLSEKNRKKILFCKKISENIKKKT